MHIITLVICSVLQIPPKVKQSIYLSLTMAYTAFLLERIGSIPAMYAGIACNSSLAATDLTGGEMITYFTWFSL